MAGNRTRVNCLEGSYAHHYTTIARGNSVRDCNAEHKGDTQAQNCSMQELCKLQSPRPQKGTCIIPSTGPLVQEQTNDIILALGAGGPKFKSRTRVLLAERSIRQNLTRNQLTSVCNISQTLATTGLVVVSRQRVRILVTT